MSDRQHQRRLNEYGPAETSDRMDKDGYVKWLSQFDFTFAKQSASRGAPHEYIVLDEDVPADENRTFYELVVFIRTNGYDMDFMSKTYRVCELGEYLYWTMGASLGETRILNRKPIGGYDEYDEAESPVEGFNDV
jgi:hypothetical protein